nr:DUF4065 domain-containing protein [Rhodoferax sp.]
MANCHEVAAYILAKQDLESGDLISNLKLQKLAYYAQGFCLAMHGRPLFPEAIEAWQHGPVVRALYNAYSSHNSAALPRPDGMDLSVFSNEDRDLMDEVYDVYGQFSAWKLRNMTHDEAPWKNASMGQEISHASLAEYFKTQLQ